MNQEKIREFEAVIEKDYANTCGISIIKDGNMIYENYRCGCDLNSKVHIYSVTKSIVSILIGILIDKGYIKSVDQKILDFFPDYEVLPDEKTIQNITLKDMLTMTTPYKQKDDPYLEYFPSSDYLKFSLDLLGGDDKIGEFRYTPLIGPDIFNGIIRNVTGQSVLDFARKNLFEPLEIEIKDNIIFKSAEEQFAFNKATDINGWVTDPTGLNTAGWGLTLSTTDMAKIGQLYLNGGVSNCKRIVSPQWIKESITPHSHWNDLMYGYLWWVIDDHSFAALGDGGNTIYVNKDKNIVVSISALFVPNAKDRIELIKRYIEPAL